MDMRAAARNNLFPSSDEVVSMSREFGVPLTADDIITGIYFTLLWKFRLLFLQLMN